MGISNPRIGDLINDVEEGRLEVRPYFQRRQVWTNTDKEFFIDTVLKRYPFPEIFVSTAALDRKNIKRRKWLVDGQQRITTLRDYVRGSSDLLYKTIPRYEDLTEGEQTALLDYEIAVRDLGTVSDAEIREIFRRINTTDYALKSMEVLNAMFSGVYKQYCEALSRQTFFEKHKVFSASAQKRMYDVTFCVTLVTTLLSGYYRRDEKNEEYLERYNDDFPQQIAVQVALDRVFDFVQRCGFGEKSRAWRQIDLFTLLVELHAALVVEQLSLNPTIVGSLLSAFYKRVDNWSQEKSLPDERDVPTGETEVFRYLKAAGRIANDKYARVDRANIISGLIRSTIDSHAAELDRPAPKRARKLKR
jgi:hypothetical protein